MKAAVIRFYFDEDVLGLAKVIAPLRTDCTYVGDPGGKLHGRIRPPCPIGRGSDDIDWVQQIAARGWLGITRDFNIRGNPAERRVVRESSARLVALSSDSAQTKWGQLELFMRRWRRIEALLDEDGPFIYLASESGLRKMDLSDLSPTPRRATRRTEPPHRPDDSLF